MSFLVFFADFYVLQMSTKAQSLPRFLSWAIIGLVTAYLLASTLFMRFLFLTVLIH